MSSLFFCKTHKEIYMDLAKMVPALSVVSPLVL